MVESSKTYVRSTSLDTSILDCCPNSSTEQQKRPASSSDFDRAVLILGPHVWRESISGIAVLVLVLSCHPALPDLASFWRRREYAGKRNVGTSTRGCT